MKLNNNELMCQEVSYIMLKIVWQGPWGLQKLHFVDHTYQPHPHVLSAHVHNLQSLTVMVVNKHTVYLKAAQIDPLQYADAACGVYILESSS